MESAALAGRRWISPHPRRKGALVGTDHVSVNRGCAQRGMAEPALHQMWGNAGLKGVDSEAVSQALRHGGHADYIRCRHDSLHAPPCGRAAPFPKSIGGQARITLAKA